MVKKPRLINAKVKKHEEKKIPILGGSENSSTKILSWFENTTAESLYLE